MEFKASDIAALAKKTGLNNKGVARLLGSVSVAPKAKSPDSEPSNRFNLGLRLNSKELFSQIQANLGSEILADAVLEYRNSCPLVVNWIMRGGFDPTKLPDSIKSSSLLHASRTAGRLRAKILRELTGCG